MHCVFVCTPLAQVLVIDNLSEVLRLHIGNIVVTLNSIVGRESTIAASVEYIQVRWSE